MPSPFGQALERALSGETVANRSVSAREVQGVPDSAGCHLLFVPAGAESRAGAFFRDAGPHTVTVGESRRFESMGGAVTLVIDGGRVCFNVNLRPVERRGIRISARMLHSPATSNALRRRSSRPRCPRVKLEPITGGREPETFALADDFRSGISTHGDARSISAFSSAPITIARPVM